MTRKDSEKDSERPHYYSQFWLDVAAGRRVIGAPKTNEETASEAEMADVLPPRKMGRSSLEEEHASSDGRAIDNLVHPVAEPLESSIEDYAEPEADAEDYIDDLTQEAPDEADMPDMDLSEEEDEEDYDEDEDEDEEEDEDEDIGWGRGRKKGKPARGKQPRKPPRPRRGF